MKTTKAFLIGLVTFVTLIVNSISSFAQTPEVNGTKDISLLFESKRVYDSARNEMGTQILFYLERDSVAGHSKGDTLMNNMLILDGIDGINNFQIITEIETLYESGDTSVFQTTSFIDRDFDRVFGEADVFLSRSIIWDYPVGIKPNIWEKIKKSVKDVANWISLYSSVYL